MDWIKRGLVGVAGLLVPILLVTTATGGVLVRRSAPTIAASSSDDLFRAQGFVHAQDRFWELDIRRHITAGRLSELICESRRLPRSRQPPSIGSRWCRAAAEHGGFPMEDTR